MTILSGDIKLVKTQVMDDVPEGGGAPTAIEIIDGASNEIFPDISEVDRAGGRVKLRKVALHIDTANRDTYLGANAIIAEPPNDPNVSITLFHTNQFFDERTAAVDRIQAYLSIGTQYPAYLFGNHIAGQSTLLIYQKTSELPAIGDTLVLTKREGFSDQFIQYVRVTEASATEQEFEDERGKYTRWIVELKLSNVLLQDFVGFDMSRFEYSKTQVALATKLSTTITADAARYYSVTPLDEAASIGDFTIKGESIFTQLVPSAQVETPIADARTNLLQAGVVPSGGVVTKSLFATFTPSQNLFIGGAIAPNTLTLTGGAIVVTDSGGRLMSAGSQVGTIDYENGLLALTVDVFGSAGVTFALSFSPAAAPDQVLQSQGFEVTAVNRSLSYVRTIEPAPVRGTLQVHYMAQGRWYVLREQGDGAIRGAETGYGAGMLNFTTGTISLTLGALPDVGSSILYMWVQPEAARASDVLTLDNNGNFYWPLNTSGDVSLEAGAKSIEPGALSMTWNDGTLRTVTDDGDGNLTGYGTGTVNYARGVVRLTPTTLPAPGTAISMSVDTAAKLTATVSIAGGNGDFGGPVTPGSVSMDVSGQVKAVYLGNPIVNWGAPRTYRIVDDGAGALVLLLGDSRLTVGSINYGAGTFTLTSATTIPNGVAAVAFAWDNIFIRKSVWQMDVAVA